MVSVAACKICGASLLQYTLDEGGFCNRCGMKFLAGGIPAFVPDELARAAQNGADGFMELAERVGMPVANVMQVLSMIESAASARQASGIFQPASFSGGMTGNLKAGAGKETSPPMGFSDESDMDFFAEAITPANPSGGTIDPSQTKPPRGFSSGIGTAPTPSLKFSYDNAFYHNQSGEVTLLLGIESSALTLQDVKLTISGDIVKPYNVNMEDFIGSEKKIVISPTVFPASSLKITVSAFDQFEQPHCWKGDAVIQDVEQTLDIDGTQHIHVTSNSKGDIGDKGDINIQGMEASQTLRRRQLAQTFRCEVILTCDDVAERRLAQSSRADRIRARETFDRAKHRVEKGRFEKAYKLIREVEEIGFMLRDAQALRARIERKLSFISLEKAKDLFGQGQLKEAYEFLQERKSLIYNQGMTDLLMAIEDIGEDCKDASEYIASGDFKKALSCIENIEKAAPKYERVKLLRASYTEAVEKAENDARKREVDQLESQANELRLAKEKEKCERELSEVEATIASHISSGQWRKVFSALSLYHSLNDHSLDVITDAIGEYNEIAKLSPLGRLAGSEEDDPDILLIADPELTIGRDPRNTIVLIDASCKTGRSQGRIVRSGAGVWQIQRCKGEFGSSVQPIEINDHLLEVGESRELSIHDVLSFSGIVKMEVTGSESDELPESGNVSSSLELSYLELLPEDEEYLELVRWILIDDKIEVGSSEVSNLQLPRIKGQAFTMHLLHDVFWIEPVKDSSVKVTVNGELLTSLRPLFHNEVICIDEEEYYFYQVRSEKELWLGEDDLDERNLPA